MSRLPLPEPHLVIAEIFQEDARFYNEQQMLDYAAAARKQAL